MGLWRTESREPLGAGASFGPEGIEEEEYAPQAGETIYVHEAPVRLWHWLNAACIVILVVTGYLIGVPLPSTTGEPSEWYIMGYIRFAHFAASYIFTVGITFRFFWATIGNYYSRDMFYFPVWRRSWTNNFMRDLRWKLLLTDQVPCGAGHSPITRVAMVGLFLLPSLFMIVTGFALYSEATGRDSWEHHFFGWIVEFWRNTQDIHTLHRLGMWVMLVFTVIHIYMVVRDDILSGHSVIGTMFSGWRFFAGRR
ncbi:hydrogenase 1 cytochrome b subunit [uncultured Gammaproteobacteria bacterium]